jgi:hypothetical protein
MARKEKPSTTFLIRLPDDVLSWVEQKAERTLASRNSEIVRCVRDCMDSEPPKKAAG